MPRKNTKRRNRAVRRYQRKIRRAIQDLAASITGARMSAAQRLHGSIVRCLLPDITVPAFLQAKGGGLLGKLLERLDVIGQYTVRWTDAAPPIDPPQ